MGCYAFDASPGYILNMRLANLEVQRKTINRQTKTRPEEKTLLIKALAANCQPESKPQDPQDRKEQLASSLLIDVCPK